MTPSLLIRLYPHRWRERYGPEFEALLAERGLGLRDVLDVARAALDAHLHPVCLPLVCTQQARGRSSKRGLIGLCIAAGLLLTGLSVRLEWPLSAMTLATGFTAAVVGANLAAGIWLFRTLAEIQAGLATMAGTWNAEKEGLCQSQP